MPVVKMPDGQLVNMPDNPDPELIAKIQAKFNPQQNVASQDMSTPSMADKNAALLDKAKGIGTEALKVADTAIRGGLFAIPKLGKDLGQLAAKGVRKVTEGTALEGINAEVPGLRKLYDAFDYVATPMKPDTKAGKVIGDVGASVVGAMVGPGALAQNAKIGLGAGLGAETAASALGDNPLSRIIGSLAGGGLTGLATMEKTNVNRLAREVLDDVDPTDLAKAVKAQKNANEVGIPINLSQAMDQPSNIDTYIKTLASSPQGKNTVKLLREQPTIIANKMEDTLAAAPGVQLTPRVVSNESQEAATKVIESLSRQRTNLWEETFGNSVKARVAEVIKENPGISKKAAISQATHVPAEVVNGVREMVLKKAATYPSQTIEHKLLNKLANRLVDKGNLITSAPSLHRTLKSMSSELKQQNIGNKSLSTDAHKFIGGEIQEVRSNLAEALKPYNEANKVYKAYTDAVINPVKKSEIGTLAGRTGAREDVNAPRGQLMRIFDEGTVPGAPSEISNIAKHFEKVGEGDTFINAAKTWMAEKITKATRSDNDRVNPKLAANLVKEFGAPQRLDNVAKGTSEVMFHMAKLSGIKDPKAYSKGFSRLMEVVAKASRRPHEVSGTTKQGIEDLAGESFYKSVGQFSLLTPIRQPALRWAAFLKDNSLSAMDRMLNSPDAVAQLIILGKQPKMNRAAQNAIATFLATNANVQNNSTDENE